MILETAVRKWGYEPVSVEDGESAWELLQQENPPELLLLDWEMPNLSGVELCRRIRENEKNDPSFIILLTSRSTTEDIVTGLQAGSNEYIAKPFDKAELQARLQVGKRMLELQQNRRKAEKYKERLQRELHHTRKMEALGQITGAIAHDFNNILGIVMGYTNMAIDRYGDEAPEKMVEYLHTSLKSSERAKELVAKMLVFTEGGDKEIKPILLNEQVEINIERIYAEMPDNIQIDCNCSDNLPTILLDPNKLRQMLLILCENARDAMDGKGVIKISVGLSKDVEGECSDCHKTLEGDWVELSVADTGTGMREEELEHLFEPFYTTKEFAKGMGMAMLHGIINRSGRHSIIETQLGKGTKVRLLFPFTSKLIQKVK